MKFFQCKMAGEDGYIYGWIEARGAKVGAMVEIKGQGYYKVLEVYEPGLEKEELDAKNATVRKGFLSVERTK